MSVLSASRLWGIRGHWRRTAAAVVAVAVLIGCGVFWLASIDGTPDGLSRPVQRGVAGRLVQLPADLTTNAFRGAEGTSGRQAAADGSARVVEPSEVTVLDEGV